MTVADLLTLPSRPITAPAQMDVRERAARAVCAIHSGGTVPCDIGRTTSGAVLDDLAAWLRTDAAEQLNHLPGRSITREVCEALADLLGGDRG
jgi:hypothetical protein